MWWRKAQSQGEGQAKFAPQENTQPSRWKILRQRNNQTMELIPPRLETAVDPDFLETTGDEGKRQKNSLGAAGAGRWHRSAQPSGEEKGETDNEMN